MLHEEEGTAVDGSGGEWQGTRSLAERYHTLQVGAKGQLNSTEQNGESQQPRLVRRTKSERKIQACEEELHELEKQLQREAEEAEKINLRDST